MREGRLGKGGAGRSGVDVDRSGGPVAISRPGSYLPVGAVRESLNPVRRSLLLNLAPMVLGG